MNSREKNIEGLRDLLGKWNRLKQSVEGFIEVHERVLQYMIEDEEFDTLEMLPTLMSVQQDLENSLKDGGLNHIILKVAKELEN